MQCGGSSVRPFRRMSRYSRFFIPRMSSVTVLWRKEGDMGSLSCMVTIYVMYWVDRLHTNCIVEHVTATLQECGEALIHYWGRSLHRVCDECTCTTTMAHLKLAETNLQVLKLYSTATYV